MTTPLTSRRDDFDLPDDVVYLNTAYMSPLPRVVVEAGVRGMRQKLHPWEVTPRDFFAPLEEIRGLVARLLGGSADAEGVAIVPAVSYGVSTAAANLRVGSGRTVVVLAEQFASDVYPWRAAVGRDGGEIVTVPRSEAGWTAGLLAAIDERTAVVAVPQVHWTDGTAVDLVTVARRAREVGAALVLDLSQSLAAAPVDLDAVAPDFVACVLYKWCLGPYSTGFLWVAPRHRDGVALEQTWTGRAGSDDFARLVDYTDDLRPGARRFDVGESANFALVPAQIAALEYVMELGAARVAAYGRALSDRLADGATDLGLGVAPPDQRLPHLTGVRLGGADPVALAASLAAEQVHVSVRSSSVRVSTHVYNTVADVERFLAVLGAAVSGA